MMETREEQFLCLCFIPSEFQGKGECLKLIPESEYMVQPEHVGFPLGYLIPLSLYSHSLQSVHWLMAQFKAFSANDSRAVKMPTTRFNGRQASES